MNRFFSYGLLAAAAVGLLGSITWLYLAHLPDGSDAAAAEVLRLRNEEEDEGILQAHFDVIDEIRHDGDRNNLTLDRAKHLRLAVAFLSSYTRRYSDSHGTRQKVSLIVAYRQLAMAQLLLRDFRGGETSVLESLRLAKAMRDYAPSQELHVLRGVNYCSLGWILAMTGRWSEAEQGTRAAVDAWQELIRIHPEPTLPRRELAICQRNLAIIREAAGLDGLPDAVASVATALRGLKASHVDQPSVWFDHEVLIDSEQCLGMIYYGRGRYSEADQVRRSVVDHLQNVIGMVESLFENHPQVPRSVHYWEALERARHNLTPVALGVERNSHDEAAVKGLSDDWRWRQLTNVPGQILSLDVLARGRRFPGEFEPQDAIVLSWQEEWAREGMTSIVSKVHPTLPVVVLVDSVPQQQSAARQLAAAGVSLNRIRFLQAKINTVWIRDFGPFSVESASGVPLWLDAMYSGHAGHDRYDDDELAHVLGLSLQVPTATVPCMIEGGAILSNGAGICVASTVLKSINDHLGREERPLTDSIKRYFGADQIVYLDPLIDEPTGHVDWFCAFTDANTIVVGAYGDEDPANSLLLDRHARRLAQVETPNGRLRVVRMPMPPRAADYFGGTYTNVVFANGVLIVPTWPEASAAQERQVFDQYRQLLPGWEIVPFPAERFGVRGGGPHCCSMNLQLPRPLLESDPET